MEWVLALLVVAVGVLAFVLATDGRYFGKRLMGWVYDRIGPRMFGARSEAQRWRKLARTLNLTGNEHILDVGTALGDLPLTLAALPDFQGTVFGVDLSSRMMAAARVQAQRRGLDQKVTFKALDATAPLPFEDGSFDLICCFGLLETISNPHQVLVEFERLLTPQGVLVLSVYRGGPSKLATLSQTWYRQQLKRLEFSQFQLVACRRTQDVLVARKATPVLR